MESLRINLKHSNRLVRYYRAEIDTQFDLLMLITEFTPLETLRQFIDQYGFLDEPIAGKSLRFLERIVKIIADIVISLRVLEKAKTFHGRLKLNNVHMDNSFKVKLNDYGIYNDIYRGHQKIKINAETNAHSSSASGKYTFILNAF